jgi:hypothetical protein
LEVAEQEGVARFLNSLRPLRSFFASFAVQDFWARRGEIKIFTAKVAKDYAKVAKKSGGAGLSWHTPAHVFTIT